MEKTGAALSHERFSPNSPFTRSINISVRAGFTSGDVLGPPALAWEHNAREFPRFRTKVLLIMNILILKGRWKWEQKNGLRGNRIWGKKVVWTFYSTHDSNINVLNAPQKGAVPYQADACQALSTTRILTSYPCHNFTRKDSTRVIRALNGNGKKKPNKD